MGRRNFREDEIPGTPGFARYWKDHDSKGLLLPASIAQAMTAEDKADAEAMTSQAAAEEADRKPKKSKHGGMPLPEIRTPADALSFAKDLLSGVPAHVLMPSHFSRAMLAAVVLQVSRDEPGDGMGAVFYYLSDPLWDSPRQMFSAFTHLTYFANRPEPAWFKTFMDEVFNLMESAEDDMGDLAKAAAAHWGAGLLKAETGPKKPARKKKPGAEPEPVRTIQIFPAEAIEKAAASIREISSEKRAVGVRILEQARTENGHRTLPNAAQASRNLEAKKIDFENLRQPIERLQTELVLARAMPAQDFRIAPMLLVGEPGIGKTYLASQLAQALGVSSDKMSAGGAQGAFQLSGSHRTWLSAKPGLVATLLAYSASAAPVLVIDEVDKIHEDRHAFLPVLLDLLDAGTAKQFRDEYFEMDFDASRIIFVLTANSIDKVPPALLSRVEVFHVPAPQPEQRLRIIQKNMVDLSQKTGREIAFSPDAAEWLADRMSFDLRQLHRLARASFSAALQAGDKVARVPLSLDHIGFSLRDWTPEPEQPVC